MSSYPKLARFLSAYFHEDWIYEYETKSWEKVVARYALEAGVEEVMAAQAELNSLIDSNRADLDEFLSKGLGCYYWPQAHGQKTVDWLEQVRAELVRTETFKVK